MLIYIYKHLSTVILRLLTTEKVSNKMNLPSPEPSDNTENGAPGAPRKRPRANPEEASDASEFECVVKDLRLEFTSDAFDSSDASDASDDDEVYAPGFNGFDSEAEEAEGVEEEDEEADEDEEDDGVPRTPPSNSTRRQTCPWAPKGKRNTRTGQFSSLSIRILFS